MMSTPPDRQMQRPASRDEWLPPAWDRSIEARVRNASLLGPQYPTEEPPRRERLEQLKKQALPQAAPFLIVGSLAAILSLLVSLPQIGSVSLTLLLLLTIAIAGYWTTRDRGDLFRRSCWLMVLVSLALVLPLSVIQVTLLREPFVSIEFGSALPSVLATIVSILAIVAVAVGSATATFGSPENAGLLFLPAALMVNAVLSAPSNLDANWAIGLGSFVYLLAGVAVIIGFSIRMSLRLLIPPVMFGIEMILLFAVGRGPITSPTSGGVVRFLYLLTMAAVIVMLLLVPALAVWMRRTRLVRAAQQ